MEGMFPEVNVGNSSSCQILMMTGLYGYVLFVAANMIGDGAELLLLVPSLAPLVGSIVLPILGAVPDGLMVLFSGLGERSEAISQVSVGMGAMAGSSVMLLTMPWFLATMAGRVSLKDGKPQYTKPAGAGSDWEKLSPPGHMGLKDTGVAIGPSIQANAKLMIATCTTYLAIQIPSIYYDSNEFVAEPPPYAKGKIPAWFDGQAEEELPFAYLSLAFCVIWFFYYLYKMYTGGSAQDMAVVATVQAIQDGKITIWGALQTELAAKNATGLGEKLIANEDPKEVERIKQILRPFFNRYDEDRSKSISQREFMVLMGDLGVFASMQYRLEIFTSADANKSGTIDFEEFVTCVLKLCLGDFSRKSMVGRPTGFLAKTPTKKDGDDDEGDDEEDEMPEDLASLTPEQQQSRIKKRAFTSMGLGSLLVLIFSDPMCDMLGVIGDLAGVPKFYVAFVLAPLASNASELIAAMKLASKKTSKSMVDSLSSLTGAAVMNNTFCMSIFIYLVISQKLAFTFKAEVTAIVAVEVLIGLLALKGNTMSLMDACIVLACYPLCLLLVIGLEAIGFD